MNKHTIDEIITNIELIRQEEQKVTKPNTHAADMKRGFQISQMACKQATEVAMSPIMKNMLHAFGDLKGDERLLVDTPETKAEKWIHDTVETLLKKYNPSVTGKLYDTSLPVDSKQLYNIDCWDNFKDNMRDIQPGQGEERRKVSIEYGKPTKEVDILWKLKHDITFQKAVDVVVELLPQVRASEEFHQINLPFMTKHTNVSYPYWSNDRAPVSPELKKKYHVNTYAELTMKQAKELPLDKVYTYNVSTAYGRNQRGKGRFLVAVSRIPNLIFNCLESVEIDSYKQRCPIFAGYNDSPFLKNVLKEMTEFCQKNNFVLANWDQSKYDLHVSRGFIELLGAISMFKANGTRSKQIALKRAAMMSKTWLVNGMTGKLEEINGRIFSGFIDTNRGGGIINEIITLYCLMKQDPAYTMKITYPAKYSSLVMGDDHLFIYDPKWFDKDKFVKDMLHLGFEVNPEKQQYGTFFLQNRLFNNEGNMVMAYPWTRVYRSSLFKETSKGLGPFGWLEAQAQQCYKLVEVPEFLKIVVNLLAPFDQFKLGAGLPVEYIKEQVRKEDAEALSKGKRALTTAQVIYDGDPTKANQYNPDGSFKTEYLQQIFGAITSAYDPNFLRDNGIKVPTEVIQYMTSKSAKTS